MKILETEYADVIFEKEKKMGMIVWKGKSTSAEYRNAFQVLLDYQKKEKITRYISDIRKQSIISPDDRKWFESHAFPLAVEQGLEIAAIVFDGNVFKKYYINVILNAVNKFGLPLKAFNDLDEAVSFVNSKG